MGARRVSIDGAVCALRSVAAGAPRHDGPGEVHAEEAGRGGQALAQRLLARLCAVAPLAAARVRAVRMRHAPLRLLRLHAQQALEQQQQLRGQPARQEDQNMLD